MNLLAETLKVLEKNGKAPSDVEWVGTRSVAASWRRFASLAAGLDYNNGFGAVVVSEQLVVVGNDWWLERHEYDGEEWWEFKTIPKRRARARGLRREDLTSGRCFDSDERGPA